MCVCVIPMHTLHVSHENILRVNAIKYLEVGGHNIQRNSPVVSGQGTIVLRESFLKALYGVLIFHRDGDVYLIPFQTFLLAFG